MIKLHNCLFMELDFKKIERIKEIRQIKSKLSEEEHLLSTPELNPNEMLGEFYKKFQLIASKVSNESVSNVNSRKKFLFIVLYIFSPSVLAGGKMPRGLRDEISNVLGLHSKSTISDNCSDILFLYQNYAKFKNEVNEIYRKLME